MAAAATVIFLRALVGPICHVVWPWECEWRAFWLVFSQHGQGVSWFRQAGNKIRPTASHTAFSARSAPTWKQYFTPAYRNDFK